VSSGRQRCDDDERFEAPSTPIAPAKSPREAERRPENPSAFISAVFLATDTGGVGGVGCFVQHPCILDEFRSVSYGRGVGCCCDDRPGTSKKELLTFRATLAALRTSFPKSMKERKLRTWRYRIRILLLKIIEQKIVEH